MKKQAENTKNGNDMHKNQDVPNSRVIPFVKESVNAERQVSNKY